MNGLLLCLMVATGSPAEKIELHVGDTVSVSGENLSLHFVAVRRDSRCPKNVQCVRAGEAVVVLAVRPNGGEPSELTFEVPPGGGARAELDGRRILIDALEPAAEAGRKIEQREYRLMVRVEK